MSQWGIFLYFSFEAIYIEGASVRVWGLIPFNCWSTKHDGSILGRGDVVLLMFGNSESFPGPHWAIFRGNV